MIARGPQQAGCSHQTPVMLQVSTDWVGLIDEWALRFFHELDYRREAANSETFAAQMEHLDGITVCRPFPRLTSRDVLTTGWVQGRPLHDLCLMLSTYCLGLIGRSGPCEGAGSSAFQIKSRA